jgi:hypothetical protein
MMDRDPIPGRGGGRKLYFFHRINTGFEVYTANCSIETGGLSPKYRSQDVKLTVTSILY